MSCSPWCPWRRSRYPACSEASVCQVRNQNRTSRSSRRGLPGAVFLQHQPDGCAAGWGWHPGLLQHGSQGPLAGPEKHDLPACVRLVTCPATRRPSQGERKTSDLQPCGSEYVVLGCCEWAMTLGCRLRDGVSSAFGEGAF